ncbi:sensory box [Vibrio sp. JCM 19236]|nr:sensory box [Vibrio sp. JCM 19236]
MYDFRFEKIVTGNKEVFGYELLSMPSQLFGKTVEQHFAELSDIEHVNLLKKQIAFLKDSCDSLISLNLSISSLLNSKYTILISEELYNIMHNNNLSICFELSESELAQLDDKDIYRCIEKLRRLGFRFWMDDFGSGQANIISLVNNLELIEVVKIDRMVFWHLLENSNELLISLVKYFRFMDKKVIIEGVENPEQNSFRESIDAYGQGYLFNASSNI